MFKMGVTCTAFAVKKKGEINKLILLADLFLALLCIFLMAAQERSLLAVFIASITAKGGSDYKVTPLISVCRDGFGNSEL